MENGSSLSPCERASAEMTRLFVDLTPDRVLEATESAGFQVTGLCYPLNSFENRVYEVELEDRSRVVTKFYRPGRWSREQILEEHAFLRELAAEEVPVCPPLPFPDGSTLKENGDILFALWKRQGGRAPDELNDAGVEQLGRLIARMHNVAARKEAPKRPLLDADRYIRRPVSWLVGQSLVPPSLEGRYSSAALAIADIFEERADGVATQRVHGDLYLGNVLFRDEVLWLLDFDDMASGPAVQDLWLAIPGRDSRSLQQRDILLEAYGQLRELDHSTLNLIEPLRGLRMVRYGCWVARRWYDPAFQRGWPHFGTDEYWLDATEDLESQLATIRREGGDKADGPAGTTLDPNAPGDVSELSNKDYFWDWEE